MDLATFITDTSISVFAVASLVYVVVVFTRFIKDQSTQHHAAMKEREDAFREIEKEMRGTLTEHIVQSNIALTENSRALERNANVNEQLVKKLGNI